MTPSKREDEDVPFMVWSKAGASDTREIRALSAKQADEKRAREDWIGGQADWPITYCVRDGVSGTLWEIDVTIATQPSFVAYEAREIAMPAATHVLWEGRALCADLRLCRVPGDWPVGQRWISLEDVARGVWVEFQDRFALPDRCAVCWGEAARLSPTGVAGGAERPDGLLEGAVLVAADLAPTELPDGLFEECALVDGDARVHTPGRPAAAATAAASERAKETKP